MPPKKAAKTKSKSESSKKARSGKKSPPNEISFKEAVLTLQLQIKQNMVNQIKDDLEDMKLKIEKQREKGKFLKREQGKHIKEVILQARKKHAESLLGASISYEDVESALQDKLVTINREETDIEELKLKISMLEDSIAAERSALANMHRYKSRGQFVDRTHMEVLRKEMSDMDSSFAEMLDFFDKSLLTIKQEMRKNNEESMTKEKQVATEEALQDLDKNSEQEFLDNKWLKKEVKINRKHVTDETNEVEQLEKLNVDLIHELFEDQLGDINEARQFYLACKIQGQNDIGVPDTEFAKAAHEPDKEGFPNPDGDVAGASYAASDAVEARVDSGAEQELPDDLKWLEDFLPDFRGPRAYLADRRVGPLEVALLNVCGTKLSIHDILESDTAMSDEAYMPWITPKATLKMTVKSPVGKNE